MSDYLSGSNYILHVSLNKIYAMFIAFFCLTGEDAVPKKIPKTIENQRVPDETITQGVDEEVDLQ